MSVRGARLAVTVLSFWLTGAATAEAQIPDLVDISGQYQPSSPLPDAAPAGVQVSSYDVTLNAPLPLGETTFLIPGAAYHVDSASYRDEPAWLQPLRGFHSVDATLLFIQLLPADWALSLRASVGVAGDFIDVDSSMIRVNGMAMATKSFSDAFVFGGGALASYSFGTLLPLPALYLDWKPRDDLRFETFLPAFATFRWMPHERLEFGVRAEVTGNAYGIRDSLIRDRWPCAAADADDPATAANETVAQPSACLDNIAYSTASAGLTYSLRMFSTVWLNMYAGHTFFRRFEPLNAEGETIGDADLLRNEALLRMGVSWRIPEF